VRARDSWIVLAVGILAVAGLSAAVGMSLAGTVEIAAIAGGASLGVFVVGFLVHLALRRRTVAAQTTAVALTTVAAVAAGSIAAAEAMFLSGHDLQMLFVILAAAGTLGLLVSMALGHRVSQASRSLGEATRRIGEGQTPTALEQPSPAEFSILAGELEAMSRRLDEARRKGRALEASRRELVAWVSHDLRTPLAGIRAMAEALEDRVVSDPATVSAYCANLRVETDRLAALVDDLFELSVIQAGALDLKVEPSSLNELVSEAMAAAFVLARAKGVRLESHVDGATPHVPLAALQMARALRNLLQNAIRHTPSDGTVWVETGVDQERAYVAVADQCGGIPEQDLARVFDPAFRGEAARTPSSGEVGGLGLAIVRGIVEAHHGEVSVRNDGPGCRFVVRLPMSRATA
jgi:signal transduction histidine kinase